VLRRLNSRHRFTGFSYENASSLYPSPLTGEGRVGVIFIFSCATFEHDR